MQTGNAVTLTALMLATVLTVGGATWDLRQVIKCELDKASYATDIRLEHGVAQIREELRTGRENTEREMNAIRRVVLEQQATQSETTAPASARN